MQRKKRRSRHDTLNGRPRTGRTYRKPSYGAAGRHARIVYELLDRPLGWSLDAIQNELGISERTVLRYLAALKEQLQDAEGRPLIEVFRRGNRRLIRFACDRPTPDPGPFDLSFLYFALTVFQFLDGTVIKDGVDSLWERFREKLPSKERVQLADFEKKFYATQHVVKDYREFSDILDEIFQCVLRQYRLRIEYEPVDGETKEHLFDPYTLAMHRGGLYLIGRSSRSRRILTLAVERIRKAEKLSQHFDYPKTYSPEQHTAGAFGLIVDDQPVDVEIEVMDPATARYIGSRRIHRTQRFQKRPDGVLVLSMRVQGTAELRNWVLGFGPHLKVLAPMEFREEVRCHLEDALALYSPTGSPETPNAGHSKAAED
jgi:predicted DNA-binding transcriptional regulator YafY